MIKRDKEETMATHTNTKPRRPWRRLAVLLAILAACALFFQWSNHSLQVESFAFADAALPEGFDGAVIVQLSDLHCAEFGENNSGLLSAVAEAAPDYIFLTGDLVDQAKPIPEGYVENLARGLVAIAPTYFVTGNHEWARGGVPELKNTLADCGVVVLSNRFVPLERQGDVILLAGIDDPNGYADQKTPEQLAAEVAEAGEAPYWILLAHRNTLFASRYSRLGANLTICGHGHGGLIRLPFTDGLFSTDRTLFPTYTAGFYGANGADVFVSRGLGNSGRTFRLFNRPQVAVLTLEKGTDS